MYISLSDGILAVTAILIFWYSFETWRLRRSMLGQTELQKKALMHQSLLFLTQKYLSPEMLYAVETLWDFYRRYGKEEFLETYEKVRKGEKTRLRRIDRESRMQSEQSTLHYQRRLVSHFYNHLATLYINDVLSKDIIYGNWSEADLRIIPEIIIPIENKLREVLQQPPLPPLDENSSLMRLYRGSKEC